MSAYFLFADDVKATLPGMPLTEQARMCASKWKDLSAADRAAVRESLLLG
jgi:hypothetical protein